MPFEDSRGALSDSGAVPLRNTDIGAIVMTQHTVERDRVYCASGNA